MTSSAALLVARWWHSSTRPTPLWSRNAFVLVVFLLGAAVTVSSLHTLSTGRDDASWMALAALTLLGGWAAVKVPGVSATVSLSDVFVFASILSFGHAPAVLAVVADGLIVSLRGRRRTWHRLLFNLAEPALSVWVAAAAFAWMLRLSPLPAESEPLTRFLVPVLAMTGVYFLVNSSLTAVAIASETGDSPFHIWRTHFVWLSLGCLGAGSIALFLVLHAGGVAAATLVAFVPLLLLLYVAFRLWIRRIEEAGEHVAQLDRICLATVQGLAMAVDARDRVTHGHVQRVYTHAIALAERLGITDAAQLKAIGMAALLHDTGKIAIPDHILNKPGTLTAGEFEQMKRHAAIGADILSVIDLPFPVVPIVRHHHENWDGSGYPDGLRRTQIPLGARILSVIDCYDALTSDRPYRAALTRPEALTLIEQRRGSKYDPAVVDAFLDVLGDPAALEGPNPWTPQESGEGSAGWQCRLVAARVRLDTLGHGSTRGHDLHEGTTFTVTTDECPSIDGHAPQTGAK